MDNDRIAELQFLMRTNSAIVITDSRNNEVLQTVFYRDFYTIQELIEEGYLEYIGHQRDLLCLRPFNSFSVFVDNEVRKLKGGEIVTMSLTQSGRTEFENWLATTNY